MDERQELTAGRAALITLFLVMLGALGLLAWEYVRTQEVTNTGAVMVMLGSGGLFALLHRMFGAEAPRSVLGHELPTSGSAQDRRARTRAYLVDAALFAGAMLVLGCLGLLLGDADALSGDQLPLPVAGVAGLSVAVVAGAVASFLVFYLVTWWLGESQSRAVERRLARLENA